VLLQPKDIFSIHDLRMTELRNTIDTRPMD
jgi:hypothetical protein